MAKTEAKRRAEIDWLAGLKNARFKMGYADDLRLIVSNDLYAIMMLHAPREDWNMSGDTPKWLDLPVVPDRRLEGTDAEFVKVWTQKMEASLRLSRTTSSELGGQSG